MEINLGIARLGVNFGSKRPSSLADVLERKASKTQPAIYVMYQGQTMGIYTKRNYAQYSEDGYKRCVVAFRCIAGISRALAHITLKVKIGEKDAPDSHPLVRLLRRPNPRQGGAAFFEAWASYLLISGNSYIEGNGPDGAPPLELWALRPDRMRIVPSANGPAGYVYEVNGSKVRFPVDPIDMSSPILHSKFFNPLDDWYGMSPIEAAAYSVDGHNLSGEWNQGLLQNSGRPSGAIIYKSANGETLSDDQFDRIKEEMNAAHAGSRNAGRMMVLEGNLDWKQIQMSPLDMDWLNGKNSSARDVSIAFNYPPMMLGIPGDNTYSNYQEARCAFHEDTVIPLLDFGLDDLNNWLSPQYGENVKIVMDVENLPALAPKREMRWKQVQTADWLTVNEKREATGYEPLEAEDGQDNPGDDVLVPAGMTLLSDLTVPPDTDETGGQPNGSGDPGGDANPEDDETREGAGDPNDSSARLPAQKPGAKPPKKPQPKPPKGS